jgi:L-ascorbate metabolism protein UlaG (beta-lactamase superfamily)
MSASRPPHWANSTGTLFKNPWPSAEEVSWSELYNGNLPVSWHDRKLSPEDITVAAPDWGEAGLKAKYPDAGSPQDYLIATWLGHAGALVEIPSLALGTTSARRAATEHSVYLCFDPIFSYRAGPTPYTGPARYRKTPCQANDLPGCDAVFISHNHFDHLDLPSVSAILKAYPKTLWFVPLGNKQWFIQVGVKEENVIEKDWWAEWESKIKGQSIKVTCVPAQHNSARSGLDKNQTLWSGWVIERYDNSTRRGAIYHAGDTGYRRLKDSPITCPAFKEIGSKFGSFDISFIPIWRGGSLGVLSYWGLKLNQSAIAAVHHAYPKDAMEIHRDVKSRNTVPVHFGTFIGSDKESQESIIEFREACEAQKVTKFGESDLGNGRADLLNIGASVVVEL